MAEIATMPAAMKVLRNIGFPFPVAVLPAEPARTVQLEGADENERGYGGFPVFS